ncbi:hypothetical protein IWX65_002955 [Arthrobacter sp. CAN_A214]
MHSIVPAGKFGYVPLGHLASHAIEKLQPSDCTMKSLINSFLLTTVHFVFKRTPVERVRTQATATFIDYDLVRLLTNIGTFLIWPVRPVRFTLASCGWHLLGPLVGSPRSILIELTQFALLPRRPPQCPDRRSEPRDGGCDGVRLRLRLRLRLRPLRYDVRERSLAGSQVLDRAVFLAISLVPHSLLL